VNLQELAADWRGPMPIGGAPGPRWRFFLSWLFPRLPWLFPLLPQRAWLKDGELIVKHKERFHRCDLRKATETEIRIVNAGWRSWSSEILEVRKADEEPVRLVLRDPFRILLNVEDLRRLAEIIGSRGKSLDAGSQQAVHYLNELAMSQKYGPDWQELIGAAAASTAAASTAAASTAAASTAAAIEENTP
jgi:hypothetical protein